MGVRVAVEGAVAVAVLVGVGRSVEMGVAAGVALATVGDTAATGGGVGSDLDGGGALDHEEDDRALGAGAWDRRDGMGGRSGGK